VEDVDEALEELALARDPKTSALDRLAGSELAGQEGMEVHVGLEDEIRLRERSLADLEGSVVDARVDDDPAEPKLVARLKLASRLGSEDRAKAEE
jgi:hypothetical protein